MSSLSVRLYVCKLIFTKKLALRAQNSAHFTHFTPREAPREVRAARAYDAHGMSNGAQLPIDDRLQRSSATTTTTCYNVGLISQRVSFISKH